MLKILVTSFALLLPLSTLLAEEPTGIERLFQQVNALEELSPGLFKDGLKEDGGKILKDRINAKPYVLAIYLSQLERGVEDSYKAGNIDVANKKLALITSLFNIFKPNLENWLGSALIDLAKADFVRWIYTNENEFKKSAETRFDTAEKIGLEDAKDSSPKTSGHVSRDTFIINTEKSQPLTAKELATANSISQSAYQHIVMFEDAINIKARLNASQEELSSIAQDALKTYHSANNRLQPNTLDRAYIGLLMAIENHLDQQHLKVFEAEISNAKIGPMIPKQASSPINPFNAVKEFVEAGKMAEAIKALDAYESFSLERFKNSAYAAAYDMAIYRKRCPKFNHPILNKLAEYNPERIWLYNQRICDEIKETLMVQGKWLE